jgi:hypothetical protein
MAAISIPDAATNYSLPESEVIQLCNDTRLPIDRSGAVPMIDGDAFAALITLKTALVSQISEGTYGC